MVLRDVPQCNCSPLSLCELGLLLLALLSGFGLDRLIGSHIERALASVGVLFTPRGHLVLTKNALTAEWRTDNTTCPAAHPHISAGGSHIL